MFTSELRKKTVFFLLATAIITLVLIIIPSESTIQHYLMNYFDLALTSDGKITKIDGTMASQVSETLINLILNLLHIIKIILGMTIVIIFVRFVNFLIFQFALRNSTQTEITSLIKTILSVVLCIVAFFIIFQSQYPNVQLAPLFTGSRASRSFLGSIFMR